MSWNLAKVGPKMIFFRIFFLEFFRNHILEVTRFHFLYLKFLKLIIIIIILYIFVHMSTLSSKFWIENVLKEEFFVSTF